MDDNSVMEAKNDKETINLLDFLSESESDVSDIVITPRKKKVKRRYRAGAYSAKEKRGESCSCSKSQTRAVVLWLAAVSITFWLLALSWLATILYNDIRKMDSNIRTVIAGNEGVPDTMHKYHSLTKHLQNNQTIIFANITEIKLQIANFSIQLSSLQHQLHDVQETIKSAPELINVPNKLKDLSTEISTWGSKIRDLLVTANTSKETDQRIQNVQEKITENITRIEHRLTELSNFTQQPQAVFLNESKAQNELMSSTISELEANLNNVNTTLSRNLQWAKDDLKEYHKSMVSLEEMTTNITAKVMSLDVECAKMNTQETLKAVVDKLSADVDAVKHTDVKLQTQLETLESSYNLLQNTSNSMLASIIKLQNSSSNIATQSTGTIPAILNPENVEVPKNEETKSPSNSAGGVKAEEEVSTNNQVPA